VSETDAAKLPRSKVGYENPAKGENHCGECAHYEGGKRYTGECRIVRGTVMAKAWCERFKERADKDDDC